MLGAYAEWMAAAAAGVSHHPESEAGRRMLFWPRFPKSAATLEHAHAVQGTARGDYSIAWRFENLPSDKSRYDSASVTIRIRLVVPPGGEGIIRPPSQTTAKVTLKHATVLPDLISAQAAAEVNCKERRDARRGFPYSKFSPERLLNADM